MGQYFQFINQTRQEASNISLPFNFGLPYAKSLDHRDNDEIQAMFRFVIYHNEHWKENDEVLAVGDYGMTIEYDDMADRLPNSYEWENYLPDKVPPQNLDTKEE
jgi:hypothetical protein